MKYEIIIFDYPKTLFPKINKEMTNLIKILYSRCYRLYLITHGQKYKDDFINKSKLQNIIQYFEIITCSAIWSCSKKQLLEKLIAFSETNKVLFVGKTIKGIDCLEVAKETLVKSLFEKLEDKNLKARKLSNFVNARWIEGLFCPKLNEISSLIQVNDHILVQGKEYKIDWIAKKLTQEMIDAKSDYRIAIKIRSISE